jgi:hypothetical protein
MLPGKKWAKTDLCTAYFNWRRWQGLLKEGILLGGLRMKDETTVDADSIPNLIETPTEAEMKLREMARQGVFG